MTDQMNQTVEALALRFTPLFNRVVVKRYEKTKTKSGIILAEASREGSMKMNQGTIIALGPDVNQYEVGINLISVKEGDVNFLKVGDKVMFGRYAGAEISLEGEKVVLLNNVDLVTKLSEFIDELKEG